jgi:hypothetical protein
MNSRPDLRDLAALLVHQALVALGELPDPISGTSTCQLDLARTTIDLLELLEERTRAARNQDEEYFLLQSLAQLRIAYVRARDATTSSQSSPSTQQRA